MKLLHYKILPVLITIFFFTYLHAAPIILNTKNATVWLPQQTITGKVLQTLSSNKLQWHINNKTGFIDIEKDQTFSFSFLLTQKDNSIWFEDDGHKIISDTIHYTLGYKPLPEAKPFATIDKNIIILGLNVTGNPYNLPLSYLWKTVKSPAHVFINNKLNKKASVEIPNINGEYFFSVTIYAGNDSATYTTYVTRNASGLHAFDMLSEHAAWIDSAIVYEITPYNFVKDGQYPDITKKLPELKELGINTIWLQPIYKSKYGQQAYDITDYFSLQPALGTQEQLKNLIAEAKHLNMRVLFDFVPNHTSIFHPYAQEVVQYKTQSHYYNFYQHKDDGAKYSSQYQTDSNGFIHYFWDDLVNLDYNNAEVQRWMIESFKYWLTEFDIDGYRIDAAWAYNARNPLFGRQLQTILKSIKPGILLLVEDKGALSSVYEKGYDAAYDWKADSGWISHWSWATDYDESKNLTIFNYHDEEQRSVLLNNALFKNGDTTHLRLRFLENNDQQRFITAHGKERTKMAAALLFSLPGIPMIYNGQEIGFERKPHQNKAVFKKDESIQSLDSNKLFGYYQQLDKLRIQHDALRSSHMQSLPVNSKTLYALQRWQNDENIIVLLNLGSENAEAQVDISMIKNQTKNANKYTDLLTGEIFSTDINVNKLNVPVEKFTTRLLLASRKD